MINFENINLSFDGVQVLRNVSFNVPPQQMTAVLGPSGSGKSTILRLIMGLIKPDSGRVIVDGEDVTQMSERRLQRARRKMGMVFQHNALFDGLSVAENVGFYPTYVEKKPWKQVLAEVMELLADLGLADSADKLPSELSGGMRRRVALARSLIYHPTILLYDEPTTGLDPYMTEVVVELIAEMNEKYSVTGIMVSHDLPTVYDIADHVVLIADGSATVVGHPSELLRSQSSEVIGFASSWRRHIIEYSAEIERKDEGPEAR
ncbi:MAG: ATP-binding cassette domain-containing protein [Planctomycetales bacterium]|nr:ATP-binding cassette domain-containing protein [bacterium]UNM09536.1 MAG: ATP-binding cassette domain-containing protein [Planctomycetales bacterium]